jgi:type I restriction enzyme R subunit
MTSLKDQIPILRDRHLRVIDLFRRHGLDGLEDVEACIRVLQSEKLRAEFVVKLKAFLVSLDTVLPRPEGLPFTRDAKRLALIHVEARNRYKDLPTLGKDVGAKVQRLIDEHVISLGIDPKIPPIQLTDANFDAHLARSANDRAKASEMEHALRAHIRKHLDEDPVLYRRLSERLDALLKALGERWDELCVQLRQLADEALSQHASGDDLPDGLPAHCAPFYRTVLDIVSQAGRSTPMQHARLSEVVVELVELLSQELRNNPRIWSPTRIPDQEHLRDGVLFEHLMRLRPPLVDAETAGRLADALLQQAKAQHALLSGR